MSPSWPSDGAASAEGIDQADGGPTDGDLALPLCIAADVLEGWPRVVTVQGLQPIAVFRLGDGYHLTAARCTHGNASLGDGVQIGRTVSCPLHGGRFDIVTGDAVAPPCTRRLATFRCLLRDGKIHLLATG